MARVKTKIDVESARAAAPRRMDPDVVPENEVAGLRRPATPSRRRRLSDADTDAVDEPVAKFATPSRNAGNDHLNNRMFFRIFQLGNELQRKAVQQLGITTVQWAVLGALSQDKFASGIPLSQLGDYLVVTRQNLDGVLKRLERDGLVQRVTGAGDKRARIVQLTPVGRTYWNETLQRIYQFYDQATGPVKFDDRVAFVHYLNALQKGLAKVELSKSGLPKRNGGG